MATTTRRRSARTSSVTTSPEPKAPKTSTRRKSTRRPSKITRVEEEEPVADEEPTTPAATRGRPFAATPRSDSGTGRIKAAAANAVEDAASLLNTVHEAIQKSPIVNRISESSQKMQVRMSPGILASFVLAIIISGIISVSVAPMFYEQGETPEVGAGLVQIQRKLHKLETSLEDVRGRLSSLAPASDIWQIKEEQKGILEKQAALGNLMKKELEKLKVQHISNERIKTEVARAIASRADPADYASYNANGRVVGHSDLYPRKGDPWFLPSRDGDWYLFSLPYVQGLPGLFTKGLRRLFPVHPKASIWLLSIPPTGYEVPGHCLPLNGSAGYVDIKLRRKIQLSSVSIEHISKITAFNITTAPREMKIFALNDINGEGSGEPSKGEELASFAYNIESTPVQVFPVETKPKYEVSQIRLEVESNYGSEDYTCLYRFKAYGDPLS